MQKRLWIIGSACLLLCVCTSAHAKRRFKYYLDPYRAESILSGFALNQRMPKHKWLSVLGAHSHERYTVEAGDTLWTISQRNFGNPFFWRKIWANNPQITNPHDLDVGQLLQYYQEGADSSPAEIPLVKLVPSRHGGTDLDNDTVINLNIKYKFRPPFFVVDEEEFIGEVSGAYTVREWLTYQEELYVRLVSGEVLPKNAKFSVVRVDKKVKDKTSGENKPLGILVRLVGEIEVVNEGEKLAKTTLIHHNEVFRRGDKLLPLRPPVGDSPVFYPPPDLKARILMGDNEDGHFFGQSQVVLLDKGAEDGMKVGYLFRIAEDTDPLTERSSGVGIDYKGEVQVISVGRTASVGNIVRCDMPILVGDMAVASQLFAEPPPRPHAISREVDIN